MESSIGRQAAEVLAPFSDGVNNSNVRYVAVTTTAAYFEMPSDWWGCYVTLKSLGAITYYYFSEQNSVLPDASLTTASPQLGWPLRDGEVEEEVCPSPTPGTNPRGPVYLCFDGSGTGVLWLRKSGRK